MAAYFLGRNAETFYLFLNTLFLFLAVLCIFRAGAGEWPNNTKRSIITFVFTAITVTGFVTDTTWFLANMSWLYPCTIALGLFCITEKFFVGDFSLSLRSTLIAIPMAFITGMSNNNTPIVAWVLIASCGIYYICIQKASKITYQYLLIFTALSLGCVIFYTAPGTYARAKECSWEFSISNIFWNSILAPNNWILLLVLLWRLLLSGSILMFIQRRFRVTICSSRLSMLTLALFLLWGVLLLAPCWGAPRSHLTFELMLACILCHFFYKITNIKPLRFSYTLLVLHILIMSTSIIPTIGGLISSHREWRRIERMAQEAKNKGFDYLIVKKSELDMTPAFSRIWKVPGSVFQYRITPTIPLIATTAEYTTHTNHQHKWLSSTWTQEADTGDHIMNPIAAKKLGLKAVYYLPDK